MAKSNKNDCEDFHFQQGPCNIILTKGDLLKETDVDVLVIPTPDLNETNPDNFVLFKSICAHADEDYKREIKKLRSELKLLNPQITFKNDRIYILAVPPFLGNPEKAYELLEKTYRSCLRLAVQNKLRKIAFPTIGCGVIGFNTKNAARIVYTAFENFIQTADGKKLDEIRVVVFDNGIWGDFTGTFMDLSRSKQAKIKFRTISTRPSNLTEMPSKEGEKPAQRRDIHKEGTQKYEDDFEDDKHENQRDSRLNPESAEFRPRDHKSSRGLRRYRIDKTTAELHILQGDILQTKVDVIVNATNESMLGKNGIDGAIHKAAGDDLHAACEAHKEIRPGVRLPTGRSRILLSYKMSRIAHYIINTAGPRYDDHRSSEESKKYLTSCYKTSLALANLYHLETISFPAISCGQHGYPSDAAAQIALATVGEYANSLKTIFFVLGEDDTYDAWVKAAGKVSSLTSMDKPDPDTSSTPKTPTTTNTPKVTEHADARDVSHVIKRSSIIKTVDESMSDDISTSVECTADQPPSASDQQEAARRVKVDNADQNKAEKSVTKNNTNQEKKSKENPPKDQRSDPPATGRGTQDSKPLTGFGRGKKNKN